MGLLDLKTQPPSPILNLPPIYTSTNPFGTGWWDPQDFHLKKIGQPHLGDHPSIKFTINPSREKLQIVSTEKIID